MIDIDNTKIADSSTKNLPDTTSIQSRQQMDFDPQLEPLLRDNPRRFVIFPIQFHDIWAMYKKVSKNILSHDDDKFKKNFHRPKHHFGQPKKLIYQKIWTIGINYQPMKKNLLVMC